MINGNMKSFMLNLIVVGQLTTTIFNYL